MNLFLPYEVKVLKLVAQPSPGGLQIAVANAQMPTGDPLVPWKNGCWTSKGANG